MNYYQFLKENSQYKKYVVWKFISSYGIFEVIDVLDFGIILSKKYLYVDELVPHEQDIKVTKTAFNRQVIFQSDNLQECIDQIGILDKAKKYNL